LKSLFSGTAAIAATLVLAGTALAKSHPQTSLVPQLAPHPQAWLKTLRSYPQDPKPAHRHATHRRRPQAQHGNTLSVYEGTVKPWKLAAQGCAAAHRHESGVVVLDFGKPAYERHGYGTILFSGHFAHNYRITSAMLGWARGYNRCLPQGSDASVALARGTSNYHPAVPSALVAGRRWARATVRLQQRLRQANLDWHVTAAAADDAEPAWDRHFRKTRLFIHGFRTAAPGRTLYDYGSLDGGVGSIWSARQAFYVAGGIRGTAALPEIYNGAMAQEWAELAAIARSQYHAPVRFAGVMTQGTPHCGCSLRPHEAHRALARALASAGAGRLALPLGGTDIISG
jgi:hypothetical protein